MNNTELNTIVAYEFSDYEKSLLKRAENGVLVRHSRGWGYIWWIEHERDGCITYINTVKVSHHFYNQFKYKSSNQCNRSYFVKKTV